MKHIIALSLLFILTTTTWSQDTWVKTFGGSVDDNSYSITTTSDGGMVLTGHTGSDNGDFKGMSNSGYLDIFVIKLDKDGHILWKRIFGGRKKDYGMSITATNDGGFVLTGETESGDGDFKGIEIWGGDIFVIKLNAMGDVVWKKTFGGQARD